jgi:hypothetical protein
MDENPNLEEVAKNLEAATLLARRLTTSPTATRGTSLSWRSEGCLVRYWKMCPTMTSTVFLRSSTQASESRGVRHDRLARLRVSRTSGVLGQ